MENLTKNHIKLTHIQKLIGQRMTESKAGKPCFYLEAKADITVFMKLRNKLRKALGIKITTNTFYIRALALAIEKYPLMAGTLYGNNIKIADHINIAFAVNASHGLVVPVIKDANKKSLNQIAREEKLLTEKARSNTLTLEDIEGETMALSNLGVYEVDSFIGIIPPPASSILAVGNIIRTAVPENSKPVVRKKVSLSLAVDHMVINGDYAARFLKFITEIISDPLRLVDKKIDI